MAPRPSVDRCAVPTSLDTLEGNARTLIARRLLACSDYEHGRSTKAQYTAATLAIDAQFRPAVVDGRFGARWATTVRGFSSQYTETSWSAAQALGAPDVYPQHGDLAHAWASRGADDQPEWIELGYDTPRAVSAIEIYETYNAGAIERVTLITTTGRRIEVGHQESPLTGELASRKLVLEVPCTSEPIAAVRIEVASQRVSGWNEIDAVGLVPCIAP